MSIRTPSTTPSGEKGGPPSEPPYSWRLFVGMLLAIVIGGAILAVLLGLNPLTFQRLAPAGQPTPIGTAPPVSAAATSAVAATPAIGPTTAPAIAPTAIPTLASKPTTGGAPVPVQTVIPKPTAQTQTVSATAAGTTGAVVPPTIAATEATSIPTSQAEPTPVQASVAPELAAAIIKGYDNYWSVRVRAMGDPTDTSIDLESVMAGDELSTASKTLSDYRDAGEAFQTTVDHQIWITRATPDQATVVDRFNGKSVKIDLATKAPVSASDIVEHFTSTFLLKNFGGTWKVVGQSQER